MVIFGFGPGEGLCVATALAEAAGEPLPEGEGAVEGEGEGSADGDAEGAGEAVAAGEAEPALVLSETALAPGTRPRAGASRG